MIEGAPAPHMGDSRPPTVAQHHNLSEDEADEAESGSISVTITMTPKQQKHIALLAILFVMLLALNNQSNGHRRHYLASIHGDATRAESRKAYRRHHGEDWKAHRELSPPPMGYFNLSCPFEWSKYSCAYMANGPAAGDIAQASADHYNRNLGSIQSAIDRLATQESGGPLRVLFAGDSLLRQLFISIGCNAASLSRQANLIEHAEVPWKAEWPCKPNAPCFVHRGQHGGFDAASLRLVNGMELHFVPHGGFVDEETAEPDILNRWHREMKAEGRITFGTKTAMIPGEDEVDVLVYNVGIHGSAAGTKKYLKRFGREVGKPLLEQRRLIHDDGHMEEPAAAGDRNNLPRTRTIYVTTPTQHYNSPDGQWHPRMTKREMKMCVDSVSSNPRADLERQLLRPGENVDAVLDYDDLELGRLHVQKGSDCSHYCMPGAPDVVGARLLEEILA